MNTCKLAAVVFFISILVNGCSKDISIPEPYSSYILMTLNPGTNLGFRSDSIIQIYLKNDSDKDFKKECTISYLLKNQTLGSFYSTENSFYNSQQPDLPAGQLKLLRKETQLFNIDLSKIEWNNQTISHLPSGQYSICVQLFIEDPISPMNIINSNSLTISIK